MRPRLLRAVALLIALLLGPAPAGALGWGGIEPAVTTLPEVRERWGPPTKETRGKQEGYETIQWVYEDAAAPGGMVRMIVDFGLLQPDGSKPQLVRALRLEPKPMVFGRATTVQAFGVPDRAGLQGDQPVLVYNQGLIVYLDKEGMTAIVLFFTPPLPPMAGGEGGGQAGSAPGPAGGAGQGEAAPPRQ
jgi:hypothetical protein